MTPTSTPWRVRAGASLFALLITGLGLRTLLADITLRPPSPTRPPVIYVESAWAARPPDPAVLPMPAAAPRMPTAAATPRIEAASRARVPASAPRVAPTRDAMPAPAGEREPFTAIASPAASAASAPTSDVGERRPLDLGPQVLRAAARDSKSTVRRMADTSGQALHDEPRSQAESLASSIARAGKPDCIGPNEGASLLSVFTIAYAAIRDQCR